MFFAFSPFQNQLNVFGNISFTLPSQFWLMPGVSSVQVDFGDGAGYRTLSQNSTVSIYYPATGIYYLNAKITTTAGTLIAKSSIQYTMPQFYIKPDSVWNISDAPLYASISDYINSGNQSSAKPQGVQPLGSGDPCSDGSIIDQANCDINPGAQVQIINGCDHVFDKPIIVVEGFDPTGATDFNTLLGYVDNQYSTTATTFYSTMRAAGYDFVFVIFTKNTSFIENNAMVLEQVIQRVNNTKQGTNKSTVIGFSMGGLIARYALRDMENKGLNHQVANYFSYDSPHQGANVPLGLQFLFNEMLTDMPYLKFIKDINKLYNGFTSEAAQQMLVTYSNGTNGVPLSPLRTTFAQNLINMGYPQTTANYGISHGRGNNTSGTTNAGVGAQFGFTNGSPIFSGGFVFLLANMYASVSAVSTTSNASILNYYFSGLKVATLFGIPVGIYPAIRIQNIKYQSAYPYDDAPGGYENTQAQFDYNFNHLSIFGSASDHGHYGHCFVPLASALDLQNQGYGSSNLYESNNMYYTLDNNIQSPGQLTGNTLSPATLSPFKSVLTYTSDCSSETCLSYCGKDPYLSVNGINEFQGSNWNEWHEGDFSNQVQLFVQRKILGTSTFPTCSGASDLCGISAQVTGPALVCNTATFNLTSVYPIQGVTYQWSFANGTLQITGGQGTTTINVSEVNSGQEVVTCKIINSCGLASTYTFNTTVGVPAAPTSILAVTTMHDIDMVVGGSTPPSVSSYNWYSNGVMVPNQHTYECDISVKCGTNYLIAVEAVNSCGASLKYSKFEKAPCGGAYIISPNPASGMVTISTVAASQLQNKTESPTLLQKKIYQIKVLGQDGNVLKIFTFSVGVNTAQINLNSLLNGTYILQIYDNVSWSSQQVVILK